MTRRIILILALLTMLVAPVSAAKPDTYLGKFLPDEIVNFTWQIDATYSPLWALYEINSDGSYRGMIRCFGCFEQTAPGEWASWYYAPDPGEYMFCANVAGDLQTFRTWTFRVGGRGNKPIKADPTLTECP